MRAVTVHRMILASLAVLNSRRYIEKDRTRGPKGNAEGRRHYSSEHAKSCCLLKIQHIVYVYFSASFLEARMGSGGHRCVTLVPESLGLAPEMRVVCQAAQKVCNERREKRILRARRRGGVTTTGLDNRKTPEGHTEAFGRNKRGQTASGQLSRKCGT